MTKEYNFLDKHVSHAMSSGCFLRLEEGNIITFYKNCNGDEIPYKRALGGIYLNLEQINHLILILQQYNDPKSDLIGQSLFDIKNHIESMGFTEESND